jgi:hypothetical protein
MRGVAGTRPGLIPYPARKASRALPLVEGPPDMIAARSHGLPTIAIPDDHCWRAGWAQLLADRRVTVVMDADGPGRELAERIAGDLRDVVEEILTVDLGPVARPRRRVTPDRLAARRAQHAGALEQLHILA